MWLKTLQITLALLLILGLNACQRSAPQHLRLEQLNGSVADLASYRGKWIIFNYWAGWCSWCIKEIPELNHLYEAYKDKNIIVFGVNFDHLAANELSANAYQLDIRYPLLLNDPIAALGVKEIPGLPITFIVNPQGKLLPPLLGGQTEQSLLKAMGH